MLFAFVFAVSASFIFGLVAYVVRPSPDQKAVMRRLAAVKVPQSGNTAEAQELALYLKTLQRGPFGWLEDCVARLGLSEKLQLLIMQADSATTPGNVMMQCLGVGCVLMLFVYLFTQNSIFAAVAALVGGYVPMALLRRTRSKRVAAFNNALPDCIDMIARSLRAGHSMVAAIAIVAEQAVEPARTEFSEVFKKQNYGLPIREALMQLLDRVPSQDLRVLVTGILVQKDTGGNLAEILDRILHVIRERLRIKGEIRIHTAQGRMTGYILCGLPIVMLGLINVVNPGYSNVLFTDPFGKKMLYTGIVLLVMGGVIIRKIINGIEV